MHQVLCVFDTGSVDLHVPFFRNKIYIISCVPCIVTFVLYMYVYTPPCLVIVFGFFR